MSDIPVLDQQDLTKLKNYSAFDVFLYEPGIATSSCLNCSGERKITFTLCYKVSTNQPQLGKACKYYNGGWHEIFDNLVFACPVCSNSASYRDKLRETLRIRSGLNEQEIDWRIDFIEGIEGKKIAFEYAGGILAKLPAVGDFYLFYGEHGMGKTGLLKALVAQAIKADIPAKYMTAAEVLRSIKETYSQNSEITEQDAIGVLDKFPLLCIDEVDVIGSSDWSLSSLREVIDRRYAQRFNKVTVFASNCQPGQLWSYLLSRLDDGYKIPVTGKYLRGHVS